MSRHTEHARILAVRLDSPVLRLSSALLLRDRVRVSLNAETMGHEVDIVLFGRTLPALLSATRYPSLNDHATARVRTTVVAGSHLVRLTSRLAPDASHSTRHISSATPYMVYHKSKTNLARPSCAQASLVAVTMIETSAPAGTAALEDSRTSPHRCPSVAWYAHNPDRIQLGSWHQIASRMLREHVGRQSSRWNQTCQGDAAWLVRERRS